MDKLIEALQAHLLDAVRLIFEPVAAFSDILRREKRLADSLFVCAILGISGLSLFAGALGGESALTPAFAFVLAPIFLFIFIAKLSWRVARTPVSLEQATCFALVAAAVLAFSSGAFAAIGMAAMRLWQKSLYDWIYKNSMANFLSLALVDPDKLEPFKDGKGFKIFTATSVAALAASLTYWVALFRAMARTLVASNRQFLVATIVSVVAFSVINALLNLIVAF